MRRILSVGLIASSTNVAAKATRDARTIRAIGLATALVLACNLPAQAGAFWCSGTVANLYVDVSGNVTVYTSWRGGYVQLCNVNQTSAGGVSATTCLSWIGLLRSSMERSQQTIIYYGDAPSCEAMPLYSSAPTPGYVMLRN